MTPDDPRHGTYAGAQRHWKDRESACEKCLAAARRDNKRRDMALLAGNPARVPLGKDAYRIVVTAPRTHLAAATGIRKPRLRDFEIAGPTKMVHRDTRNRILSARVPWTAIGVQRRLQALACGGWSGRALAERTGVEATTLCELRRRDLKFVRAHVAAAVLDAYTDLAHESAPEGRSATEARNYAISQGWSHAHAWLDIDDPHEVPDPGWRPLNPTTPEDIDPVVVERVLAGDPVEATTPERREIVRRWRQSGRRVADLARLTGWKPERYYDTTEESAA